MKNLLFLATFVFALVSVNSVKAEVNVDCDEFAMVALAIYEETEGCYQSSNDYNAAYEELVELCEIVMNQQ